MDEKTREALEASIAHWEKNARSPYWDEVSTRAEDCALCAQFIVGDNPDCAGCPVSTATGKDLCRGTPYPAASSARQRWCRASQERSANMPEAVAFRAAAQAEVDFLKGLRPEDEGTAYEDKLAENFRAWP